LSVEILTMTKMIENKVFDYIRHGLFLILPVCPPIL
jgi:hypothetical protein